MNINLAALRELRCRYGCEHPVGIFHLPQGSADYPDLIQALCERHAPQFWSACLVDLRLRRKL